MLIKGKKLAGIGYTPRDKVDVVYYVYADGTRSVRQMRRHCVAAQPVSSWARGIADRLGLVDLGNLDTMTTEELRASLNEKGVADG